MISFIKFLIRRSLAIPVTFVLITAVLYGIVMLTPPETRATLYVPNSQARISEEAYRNFIEKVIEQHGLNDPYPVQYVRWLSLLLQGEWGYSPTLQQGVLEALILRTPATVELTLYSLLLFLPLGLLSGAMAGWRRQKLSDRLFRAAAYIGTSVPVFVLGLMMLSIFYVSVRWFPPGRIGVMTGLLIRSDDFTSYTGLITLDGLLNGRLDVTLEALRHLVVPALALSFAHWATLGRLVRAGMIEELDKDYIVAARSRGLHDRRITWVHALRNTLAPALTSSALSAASVITGVYIVETVFAFHGVSELITRGMIYVPDAAAALGFAVHSVLLVLPVMFVLDVIKAAVDPRIRDEAGI